MTGGTLLAAAHGGLATSPDVSIGHLLLQMVLALAVVVGGIWGLSKVMARVRRPSGTGGAFGRRGPSLAGLTVISRQQIGKGKSIAVVRAGDQSFLVGIADSGLTPLGELRPGDDEPEDSGTREPVGASIAATSGGGFDATTKSTWLEALREATVRR